MTTIVSDFADLAIEGDVRPVEWPEEPEAFDRFTGELAVRKMLIRLAQIDAEEGRLTKLIAAITQPYADKRTALGLEADEIRSSIQTFIERFNGGKKLAFPDVGTAYLTTRKAGVTIEDSEAVERAYLDRFAKTTLDRAAFLKWAAEQMRETGEVPEGCEVTPESKTLAVRPA